MHRTLTLVLSLICVNLQAQTQPALNNILDLTHVLTEQDPTIVRSVKYLGEHDRHMWIVVDGRWSPRDYPAHVFDVAFDRTEVEFQVHTDVGNRSAAREQVDIYARIFGQVPASLMEHLREIEIHQSGGSPMSARLSDTAVALFDGFNRV